MDKRVSQSPATAKRGKAQYGGRRLLILTFWLIVWQLVSLAVHQPVLMAGPVEAFSALTALVTKASFWLTLIHSLGRIVCGFGGGLLLGLLLACLSARFPLWEDLLTPPMTLLKAVPVASVVVLLLIWWGSGKLSIAVSFLVVLPQIYTSTLEGLKCTDRQLLEMARVFHMPLFNRFFYLYRPALKPFLDSALNISLGMCWKSGVAAEVIGTPAYSIGERLYMSKISLETADVFAWTAVVILLSFLFGRAVLWVWRIFLSWEPSCWQGEKAGARTESAMELKRVDKSYGQVSVLRCLTEKYEPGGVYFLTLPSGAGKTTILRLLAGLEEPDSGQVKRCAVGMVFQEDRLCLSYSAVRNVQMVAGSGCPAAAELGRLLPEEALYKPCSQLSGGMKRRVAIVRAVMSASEALLLDEPFAALDPAAREAAVRYILDNRRGRTLLIATHQREDIELVNKSL